MKVRLPENLSEIKLSQYKRYKKVVMDNQEDEVFCAIQMVAIFCELSVADVMKIPRDQFAEIVEHLAKVLDQRPQLVRTFKMDGVKYGFIPNFEKATLGEYADADSLLNDDERLELLMTVLYRPITRQAGSVYEIEPYQADEAKSELFKDVRMDVVIGAVLFFYRLNKELLKHSLRYSLSKMTEREALEDLEKGGDGITALYELQERFESDHTNAEQNRFMNHSRFYHT